jgi:hypothetical protein
MASWTNIADATLEPGKPIRAIDARALRENPIAIAEGAAGAPKIETAGITDLNVTTAKIADLNVTTAKIADANVTSAKLATGNNERDWVLARTAAAAVGVVGTYAFLIDATDSNLPAGSTSAGSNLGYSNALGDPSGSPSGTWRLMGRTVSGSNEGNTSLWLRIS